MTNNSKYGIREDKSQGIPQKIFVGSYKRTGAKLAHNEQPAIRLVIGTRLNPTKDKAKHFLLLMEGKNMPAIYFSSMYPTQDPNLFEVEHEGVRYKLVLDSDKAEVLLFNQNQQAA